MKVHRYTIKLLDPLFYSREGLSGAISPRYIHATALNHGVLYALGKESNQPYIISEKNGGRNTPRYGSSFIDEAGFYFTPARPKGNIRLSPEIVKGEADGFIIKGYGSRTGKPEVLKASQLFFIVPETEFEGFVFIDDGISVPSDLLIRLGSFRGKAKLNIGKGYEPKKEKNISFVNHPVDPLVSEVLRGVMINMFPYPIVENAICRDCLEIKRNMFVAIPKAESKYDTKTILRKINEIEEGLEAVHSDKINDIEKATLLLYMSRTIVSINLYLEKQLTQDELDRVLSENIDYQKIRKTKRGTESLDEDTIERAIAFIKRKIKDVKEKIKEKDSGTTKTSRTSQTYIF